MKEIWFIIIEILIVLFKLIRPGGLRQVIADQIILKQQLIVMKRKVKRSPNMSIIDKIVLGLFSLWVKQTKLKEIAIILKPSTLLKIHKALVKRKYRKLFSNKGNGKPGPKGPPKEIVNFVLEMKSHNKFMGYQKIAEFANNRFEMNIDNHVVRRILAKHYRPRNGSGPSWLTFWGTTKDSLWSVDFFRVESITLKSHWVMVVMDQYSRKIIGFAVSKFRYGDSVCRMFNEIITKTNLPSFLSSDNDPLFTYHKWKANLRILDIKEIKTLPYAPRSHPFVERLIGTIRREYLDHIFFFGQNDLEYKLQKYKNYYNEFRVHTSLEANTPDQIYDDAEKTKINLSNYLWRSHCKDLFKTPEAA